jgi:hypothetical protein
MVELAKLSGKILVASCGEVGKTRIGHRLPAAGLLAWHNNLTPHLLKQTERCDSHPRVKLIDVAGYEQTNAHHQ